MLIGVGSGTLSPRETLATNEQPRMLAVTDLDGDGALDAVSTDYDTDTDSILLGHGDGTYAPRRLVPTRHQPAGLVVGDVTGDGIPDLAIANFGSQSASFLEGRCY